MRRECLGSLAALLAGAGLGLAQPAPEPAVLALPAPHARLNRTDVPLPDELPPLTDSAASAHDCPGLFPLPGAGLCGTADGPLEDSSPYCEPAPRAAGKKGNDRACAEARCRFWASADPLLWWVRPGHAPPLVGGAAGGPLEYGMQVGGRVAAGFVNAAGDLGLEGAGLFFGRATTHPAATPGVGSSTQLWGAEANVVGGAYGNDRLGIDLVGGLRYLTAEETLGITPTGTSPGADPLRTRNQFFGGQLGSQVEVRWGRLYTNLLGKVAVGNMHQVVDAHGDVTASHDEFGLVPEVNFNVGYQVRPGLRLYAGYTFLYLNDVTRPGDQVTSPASAGQVPAGPLFGTSAGSPPLSRTDFWTQGVNFGLALRY
jgi:hypothetical protein